jgi:N-acetylglutamate synthase and related acetyltransferases
MTFEIEELSIPERLDDSPAARDFVDSVEARNVAYAVAVGTDEMSYTAEELLPGWQPSAHEPRRLFGARVDGRIVARGIYETRTEGDAVSTAWVGVQVHPDYTGRGIGRALADVVEGIAHDEDREKLHAYVTSTPAEGPRLVPPTGAGWVPAEAREVRFMLSRDYELGQVERGSRLPLPVAPDVFASRLPAAEAASADYRVHLWQRRTPREFLDDLAVLATRMSTDAPSGALDEDEDLWTVERWLEQEEQQASSPRVILYAAVEHVASGRLVGYTELSVPPERDRPADQGDTIVMREHRGHRLGMLLKLANIAHLEEAFPGHPSIITFNAEENRPMLDVNEAVGFVPFTYDGAWHKKLR